MVSREEVLTAYRFLLGRDPENEEVVSHHIKNSADLAELRSQFIDSDEFRSRHSYWFEPTVPMQVDMECTPEEREALLRHTREAWSRLGEMEPMWSVLTHDRFKAAQFPSHSAEFYQSGKQEVTRYTDFLVRNGVNPQKLQSCLELGCGVGRLTRWLSEMHPTIWGIDVSPAHLRLAEQYLTESRVSNAVLRQIESVEFLSILPPFDAFFSVIVLQHNSPPVISFIIESAFRLLRPRGVAYFQVPTYSLGYSFDVKSYLSNRPAVPEMEMHALPQKHIFALAEKHGCSILEVEADNQTGIAKGISNTFLFMKTG